MSKLSRITHTAVLFCMICAMLFVPNKATAGAIEDTLKTDMQSIYTKALSLAGRDNFSGMCGLCTGRQLQAAGVFNKYVGSDGNTAYKKYISSKPSSGLSVTAFPGKYESGSYTIEQICNLIDKLNVTGQKTYTVFCFETGSGSTNGQKYGHVLLVHAIYNGNVYWGESTGAQTRVAPISKFASQYAESGNKYHFDGAVSFGYKELQEHFFEPIDSTPRIAVSIKDSSASDTCRLQSMPYDATEYYTGKVEKGGIIYIKGAVKNSYGNTWYVTEDNLYVYKGDVEITEADASFSAKSAADFVGVVKTKDGYLKKKPFEAADHIDGGIVAKGKTVTIVGKVTNSHNNVWYVTDKGYYIYSGDVTTYVSEDLFPINATFKNTEKRASHVVPYLDSDEKNTIKKDANVTVTKFVTNGHGNIWAQLEDGSYLCFYDKETGENKLKFVSVSQKTTVSGFPTNSSDSGYPGYPTGDRDPKTSCALRGTIKSVAPMLSIEARVTNLNTNKEVLSVTAKPKYDLHSAKINGDITNRDGSKTNINNKMSFSKVADDGYYVYEIAVQHGFVYEGKTFSFGDETVVFDSTFTIGDPEETLPDVPVATATPKPTATPTPKPTSTPTPTQVPTRLPGDVNDDGIVDIFDIIDFVDWYCGRNVEINTRNADVDGNGSINVLDIIIIVDWYCGRNVQLV